MTRWSERTTLNSCALSDWFPQLPITLLLGCSPVFMRCWPDCTPLPSYPKSDFSVSRRISMLEAPVSHYWKFKLIVKLLGSLCLLSHAEEAQFTLKPRPRAAWIKLLRSMITFLKDPDNSFTCYRSLRFHQIFSGINSRPLFTFGCILSK